MFCYDSDNHGKALIDGYHWKLTFMQNERIIDIIEGINGEDKVGNRICGTVYSI